MSWQTKISLEASHVEHAWPGWHGCEVLVMTNGQIWSRLAQGWCVVQFQDLGEAARAFVLLVTRRS